MYQRGRLSTVVNLADCQSAFPSTAICLSASGAAAMRPVSAISSGRIIPPVFTASARRAWKAQGPPLLAALIVSEERVDQAVRRRTIHITPSPPSKLRRAVEGSGTKLILPEELISAVPR